jgi:asparagine synthase (glutamine-hydrolysing)
MCGILGNCGDFFLDRSKMFKLLSSLKRRGPDSDGVWTSSDLKVSLAHTRLAVIDTSNCGHQPMISSSGRYVITFNGEIYNFADIKKELEIHKNFKIKWKSNTDTEVFLEAIEFFGLEETLNKCDGMFAFGLYDNKNKNLFLIRDRFGEKPLYFGWVKKNFIFSSDLSILKKYPNFN